MDGNLFRNGAATTATGWQYEEMGDTDYNRTASGDYVWYRIALCEWEEGNIYSVRIRGRGGGVSYDKFVVTADRNFVPSMADTLMTAETETVIEAESVTLDALRTDITEDATLESGKYVQLEKQHSYDSLYAKQTGNAPAIGFKVTAKQAGTHYVWGKFVSFGTMYASVAGSGTEYTTGYYKPGQNLATGVNNWYLIGTYKVSEAGETICVRLIGRNGVNKIDSFYVTTDSEFVGVKPHEHTFSETWSSDISYHWHPATCGCVEEISDKAVHTYANGSCTVCSMEQVYIAGSGAVTIEAENVTLVTEKDATFGNLTPVTLVEDAAASGGKTAQFAWGGRQSSYTTTNQTDLTVNPAHISFKVKAEQMSTYYVWVKLYNTGKDQTIYSYIDGNTYTNFAVGTKTGWCYELITFADYNSSTTGGYVWRLIGVCNWTAGETYSVRLRGRDGKTSFDTFVVATDPGYAPDLASPVAIFQADTLIEAENTTLDYAKITVNADETAGNGAYVTMDKIVGTDTTSFEITSGAVGAINFRVQIDTPGTYHIWGKFIGKSSVYYSATREGTLSGYARKWPSATGWYKLDTYTVNQDGEVICVRISARQLDNKIDQFYVTADSAWNGTT